MIIFDPTEHSPTKCQGVLAQVVAPRPIAMISTTNESGSTNVAPYSYYMAITGKPMLVGVTMGAQRESDGQPKHTYRNARRTGDFVINVTTDEMRDHIETAAMEFPDEISELDEIGWTSVPSQVVQAPSLAESPVHLECRIHKVIDLGEGGVAHSAVHLVVAEVVCVTLDDAIATSDYRVHTERLHVVGRMGFPWFTRTLPETMFQLPRIPYAEFAQGTTGDARS